MCRLIAIFQMQQFIVSHFRALASELNEARTAGNYRVATTDRHPVIRRIEDKMRIDDLIWGVKHPLEDTEVVNARAEKIDKGMWAPMFRNRRCLVPGSGFYESPVPYFIRLKSHQPFCFAGLWTDDRFAIATCEPNEIMRPIHNRMPVLLTSPEEWETWLERPAKELLRPIDSNLMEAYPVEKFGTRSSPRNIERLQTLFG